jgi:hypothetical protein
MCLPPVDREDAARRVSDVPESVRASWQHIGQGGKLHSFEAMSRAAEAALAYTVSPQGLTKSIGVGFQAARCQLAAVRSGAAWQRASPAWRQLRRSVPHWRLCRKPLDSSAASSRTQGHRPARASLCSSVVQHPSMLEAARQPASGAVPVACARSSSAQPHAAPPVALPPQLEYIIIIITIIIIIIIMIHAAPPVALPPQLEYGHMAAAPARRAMEGLRVHWGGGHCSVFGTRCAVAAAAISMGGRTACDEHSRGRCSRPHVRTGRHALCSKCVWRRCSAALAPLAELTMSQPALQCAHVTCRWPYADACAALQYVVNRGKLETGEYIEALQTPGGKPGGGRDNKAATQAPAPPQAQPPAPAQAQAEAAPKPEPAAEAGTGPEAEGGGEVGGVRAWAGSGRGHRRATGLWR